MHISLRSTHGELDEHYCGQCQTPLLTADTPCPRCNAKAKKQVGSHVQKQVPTASVVLHFPHWVTEMGSCMNQRLQEILWGSAAVGFLFVLFFAFTGQMFQALLLFHTTLILCAAHQMLGFLKINSDKIPVQSPE